MVLSIGHLHFGCIVCLLWLLLLLLLVVPALAQQQCLIGLITEMQRLVDHEIKKHSIESKFTQIFSLIFALILVAIIALSIGTVTYDAALRQDWAKEQEEHESARHTARVQAVCALHGESACACMGKYILGRALDGASTQEQDANELWAQQMKPTEANEEYREHVD